MGKNGNENGNGHKLTKHHIIAKSRGGKNSKSDNIINIPDFYHIGWHTLFGNLTPDEAIDFIERVFKGKGRIKRKKKWETLDLYDLQLKLQRETLQKEKQKEKK